MARRRTPSEPSPEERARDTMAENRVLQTAQNRQDLVDARIQFRNQALAHGIPSAHLPAVSQIRSMDDSTWNMHNEKINRMGFYGVDDMGRPLAKPATNPLVKPAAAVTPRTGGPLDDVGLNRFSTTPGDARAIAAKYGAGEAKTTGAPAMLSIKDPRFFASKAPAGYDYNLGTGEYVKQSDRGSINGVALSGEQPKVGPSPTAQSPVSPLDAISNPPKIDSGAVPSLSTALLGVPSGQEVPPGAAVRAGEAARKFVESTRGPMSGFESFRPTFQPQKPIFDVPAAIGRGVQSVKDVASSVMGGVRGFASGFMSGTGDRTGAGVSNASASQFEKPTKENPAPVTPTTPTANVEKTETSLSRFGASDDELSRRKFAFAGF